MKQLGSKDLILKITLFYMAGWFRIFIGGPRVTQAVMPLTSNYSTNYKVIIPLLCFNIHAIIKVNSDPEHIFFLERRKTKMALIKIHEK